MIRPTTNSARPASRFPDFLIIGAMKSATTTLYSYLKRHPLVFVSKPKEPMFFSRDHVYGNGSDWYAGLFADAGPEQVCGEASTCYSRWPTYPSVPERIHSLLPDSRFIYVLRHPVERSYSHYRHVYRNRDRLGLPSELSFSEALDRVPEIIDASRYMMQIDRYLEYFDRERFLFIRFDELAGSPQTSLDAVSKFLGIPAMDLVSGCPIHDNPHSSMKVKQRFADRAVASVLGSPVLRVVGSHVPESVTNAAKRLVVANLYRTRKIEHEVRQHFAGMSSLDAEIHHNLLNRFEDSTVELEEFLGWDLADWKR